MTRAVRVGIAGFGRHAAGRILPVIESDERFRLAAVWTRSQATSARLRERADALVTDDFAAFLASELDLVYVSSPSGLHFEHTVAALEAGHHAWVEKPIATRHEQVHALLKLAESRDRMLGEAYMFPWHAQAAAVQQVLAEGRIGALRRVALCFSFPHLPAGDFRYDPALGGGAFLDHACYLLKALDLYLGGDWTLLGGCLDFRGQAVDQTGAAQLRRAADGVIAQLNWGFGCNYINEIEFVGERGRLLVNSAFTKPATRPCNLMLEDGQGERRLIEVAMEDPYRRMLEGFLRQLGAPASWPGIRQDIARQAERFFGLQTGLTTFA